MPITVNMHKAKSDLSHLVRRALAGEDIIITKAGKPVARLVPIRSERVPGTARGMIRIADSFFEPLPEEVISAFESV